MARKPRQSDPETPLLEWICGGIGLILFVGVIAVTTVNGLAPNEPASFTTLVSSIRTDADGLHHVAFNVSNRGDETAAAVKLNVRLQSQSKVEEQGEIDLEFLPPHSSRTATVIFVHDPRTMTVVVKPLAYREP